MVRSQSDEVPTVYTPSCPARREGASRSRHPELSSRLALSVLEMAVTVALRLQVVTAAQ